MPIPQPAPLAPNSSLLHPLPSPFPLSARVKSTSKPKQPIFPIVRLQLTKILERGGCPDQRPQTPRARASLGLRVSEHTCVSEHVCQRV